MSFAESLLNGYYAFNTDTGHWISSSNSSVQIRYINTNWHIGTVVDGTYNIYYILSNYSSLDRGRLSSEMVYYGNLVNDMFTPNT
jgi:hypothetical protein